MHLSILLWLPLAAAVVGVLLPGGLSRLAGVAGALATLVLAVIVLVQFDSGAAGLQFVTDESWISACFAVADQAQPHRGQLNDRPRVQIVRIGLDLDVEHGRAIQSGRATIDQQFDGITRPPIEA